MSLKTILVTGGRGFVGTRLVQMLSEKEPKTTKIISLDIKPSQNHSDIKSIEQVVGDFTDQKFLLELTKNVDILYHVGGLVGPYYPKNQYYHVNVEGTKNILEACKINKIKILIFCSSPSTRFQGPYGHDINGLQEKDLDYPKIYTHLYSETKALAEQLVLAADSENLMTCAVAPHQVYGPGDQLFFPPVVANAEAGRLRIIGNGENFCSYTYVDNICYALILAGDNISKNPQIRGQFFIITDGVKTNMWDIMDKAVVQLGYSSISKKIKVPAILVLYFAYILEFIGKILNRQISVLNPYAVRMMTINRYFNIEKSQKILGYKPLVQSDKAWEITCQEIKKEKQLVKQQNLRNGKLQPVLYDSPLAYVLYILMMAYVYFFQYDRLNLISNPKDWGVYDLIFYIGLLMFMQSILDYGLLFQYKYAEKHQELIKSYSIHLELDFISNFYILLNRLQALHFIYFYLYYTFNYPGIKYHLNELTIINTIVAFPAYFVIYDLMYYFFHKYLHHPAIYKYIHKHHHRQFTPSRGNIDGINTHPIEYLGGSYMHIAAAHIFGYNHMYTMIAFMIFGGYLASINHTRIPFKIFGVYSVVDHDIHHNEVTSNYGQYCMVWDYLFKTRNHVKAVNLKKKD